MSTPFQLRTEEVRGEVARYIFQTSNRLSRTGFRANSTIPGRRLQNQGYGGAHAKYFRMHSRRRRWKDHDASLTASVPRAIPPSGVGEESLDCSGVTFYRYYRCRADKGRATSEPVHKPPHEGRLQRKIPQVVRPKGETVARRCDYCVDDLRIPTLRSVLTVEARVMHSQPEISDIAGE